MDENKNDIENYEFRNFSSNDIDEGSVINYAFKDLNELTPSTAKADVQKAKLERLSAEKKNFTISPIVKEHRGHLGQEKEERERKIAGEVSRRIEIIRDEAYKEGFEEGINAGRLDVYDQTKVESEEKLTLLTDMINEVLTIKENIISNQKEEIYKLIKDLTKWVILRELKDDGAYVTRLLEKLITEAQTTSNLLIQVNKNQFSNMPEVLESVENVLGKLENVRVEIDSSISENGIIVDSDNGIINGNIEQQFENLNKLFESVLPDDN